MTFNEFVSWFEELTPVDQRLIVQAIKSKESLTQAEVIYLCRYDFLGGLSDDGLDWLQQAIESPEFNRINTAINAGGLVRDKLSNLSPKKWHCSKCEYSEYETDRFAATGAGLAKLFDIQNKQFITVTCTRCRYTEIYKDDPSGFSNVLDWLIGR